MRRLRLSLLAVAGVVTALACSETSIGPRESSSRLSPGTAGYRVNPVTAPDFNPESYNFDISPSGGVIALADRFTLQVPPNAVCDPSSSSYGNGHWDDDCTITDKTVSVHAKVWTKDGRVYVDFSPALRFAPSAVVTLSTNLASWTLAGRTDLASQPNILAAYALMYSPDGKNRIDEFHLLGDASLVTYINLTTGVVRRRIKHFSGYLISSGEPCDETLGDPNCIPDPNDPGGVRGEQ
jgi:hypothetical protein